MKADVQKHVQCKKWFNLGVIWLSEKEEVEYISYGGGGCGGSYISKRLEEIDDLGVEHS